MDDKYLEYAEALNELLSSEMKIRNMRRLCEELKAELTAPDNFGSYGLELTGHAFKQISERLETLAMENPIIYKDVFKKVDTDCLLLPSNLKTFIITILAGARKEGGVSEERSRNGSGSEFRYTANLTKWSVDRNLQFVCIVENNCIKTGFFNFV